jgi:hypothetical protein
VRRFKVRPATQQPEGRSRGRGAAFCRSSLLGLWKSGEMHISNDLYERIVDLCEAQGEPSRAEP